MRPGFREMFLISILLGIVAAAYVVVIRPHARQRHDKIAEMRSMDAAISKIRDVTSGLEDIRRRIDRQQQATASFNTRLTGASEIQKSISDVIRTAAANSLQSGEVLVLERRTVNGVGAQPVHLQLNGSFNGIYSFLLQLEGMPRVLRVSQLNLRAGDDSDDQIKADLTLTMYFDADSGHVARTD